MGGSWMILGVGGGPVPAFPPAAFAPTIPEADETGGGGVGATLALTRGIIGCGAIIDGPKF
jgi:hypothetical protein